MLFVVSTRHTFPTSAATARSLDRSGLAVIAGLAVVVVLASFEAFAGRFTQMSALRSVTAGAADMSLMGSPALASAAVQMVAAAMLYAASRQVFGNHRLVPWVNCVAMAYVVGALGVDALAITLPRASAQLYGAGLLGGMLGLIGATLLFQQLRLSWPSHAQHHARESLLVAAAGMLVLQNVLALGGIWMLLTDPGHALMSAAMVGLLQQLVVLSVPLLLTLAVFPRPFSNVLLILWIWASVVGCVQVFGTLLQLPNSASGDMNFRAIGSGAAWAGLMLVVALLQSRPIRRERSLHVAAILLLADSLRFVGLFRADPSTVGRVAWALEGAGLLWAAMNVWPGLFRNHSMERPGRESNASTAIAFEKSFRRSVT